MASFIPSFLCLENGAVFPGFSPNWLKDPYFGETIFTTGMTGYPESLTDPSYAGQILTFTYPLIGNYGVPSVELWESERVQPRGVVVSEACANFSHHAGLHSLTDWLHAHKIPLITGVDTRALTKMLRQAGTMQGAISLTKIDSFPETLQDLVSTVSLKQAQTYNQGQKLVIAVDCGMKENIVRSLTRLPITLKRVPHDYDYTNEPYDGLFLSNGPGDPSVNCQTIAILKKALTINKPIFGICLGTQLMGLAAGAKTYKLPFGHRGQNQPCIDLDSKRCYITSQNHGYAIDESSLPNDWRVSYRNLNDGSVEGIAHKTKPFFSVQFHPEATPGPTDTEWLFKTFYQML